MSGKSSNLNLYASDNLAVKSVHIVSVDAGVSYTSPSTVTMNQPTLAVKNPADASKDVPDLLQKLKDMTDASNANASDIATNTASISAESTARALGDATLQGNLDAETAARTSADTTLQSNIDTEAATRAAAVTAEGDARAAADSALDVRVTALEGVDTGYETRIASLEAQVAALTA